MMRATALVACALLAGCDTILGLRHFPDAGSTDPFQDASPFQDAPPPGTVCFGIMLHPCFDEASLAPDVTYATDAAIDTDAPSCLRTVDGVELCVIAATSIVVKATVRATGSHALMLAAARDLEVGGLVDVSSSLASMGAGANDKACLPIAALAGGTQSAGELGAGGGAGGSFQGMGGAGGPNENGQTPAALGLSTLGTFRAGCPGGPGGIGSDGGVGALGGASGGTVYLLSGNTIVISGRVTAAGAGGSGGAASGNAGSNPGGGGGGSGGLVVLDGAHVDIAAGALVLASGGGGGGGAADGTAGLPGNVAVSAQRALGGVPALGAGQGGAGSGGALKDGLDGSMQVIRGGAGGGGGGAGFIRIYPPSTMVTAGTVVPPQS